MSYADRRATVVRDFIMGRISYARALALLAYYRAMGATHA